MSRLPITIRLTLVFAVVMAAVLVSTGLFLYLRLGDELDRTAEAGLRSRADDVAAFVRRSDPRSMESAGERLTDAGESFAQIVAHGKVVGTSPGLGDRALLTAGELEQAHNATVLIARRSVPQLDGLRRGGCGVESPLGAACLGSGGP